MPILSQEIFMIVPIYRESEEAYNEKINSKIEQRGKTAISLALRRGVDQNTAEEDWENNKKFIYNNLISWRYNRIIGWIEFYATQGTIKADLWMQKW
jgi:hypothetical protein